MRGAVRVSLEVPCPALPRWLCDLEGGRAMRSLVRKLGYGILSALPLALWEWMMPRDVVGLNYHVVSDNHLPHVRQLFAYKSVAAFRNDLAFLKANYHVVGYSELHEHRLQGKSLPTGSVAITFDDGFAECFSIVRPLLLEFQLPCHFFINSNFIDNRAMFYRNKVSLAIDRLRGMDDPQAQAALTTLSARLGLKLTSIDDASRWAKGLTQDDEPMVDESCALLGVGVEGYLALKQPYLTREQIVQLVADGFTIGAHTRSHRRLKGLKDSQVVTREIVDSCDDVRQWTGQKIVPFAFPFLGSLDRDLLARIRDQHDFVGLLFDTWGMRTDPKFIVNRIGCDAPPDRTSGGSNLPWLMRDSRIALAADYVRGRVNDNHSC